MYDTMQTSQAVNRHLAAGYMSAYLDACAAGDTVDAHKWLTLWNRHRPNTTHESLCHAMRGRK